VNATSVDLDVQRGVVLGVHAASTQSPKNSKRGPFTFAGQARHRQTPYRLQPTNCAFSSSRPTAPTPVVISTAGANKAMKK
jgi:hypothetical protein